MLAALATAEGRPPRVRVLLLAEGVRKATDEECVSS
jgi:hypothetical protein